MGNACAAITVNVINFLFNFLLILSCKVSNMFSMKMSFMAALYILPAFDVGEWSTELIAFISETLLACFKQEWTYQRVNLCSIVLGRIPYDSS